MGKGKGAYNGEDEGCDRKTNTRLRGSDVFDIFVRVASG